MGRRACVAIGVSRPEGLDELKGAVSAARFMGEWAKAAGFEDHVVVDVGPDGEALDVTVDRLRDVFKDVLSDDDIVDHLIVFFAGHGLSRDFRDQQWLLNRWRTYDEESLKLSAFVRKLQRYQPSRVTIIADACQNIPGADDDTNQGSGVLPTSLDEPRSFKEDRFQATEFGKSAYMLPGPEPVCLFSNVMVAALAGAIEGSKEARHDGDYITSESLESAVTAAMEAQCVKWNLSQRATLTPGFHSQSNVYAKLPLTFIAPPLAEPAKRKFTPRPLGDRIVVKRVDEEEKTSTGIIIPDTAREKPQAGEVVAVGRGKKDKAGKRAPVDVAPGDRILFAKWSGIETNVEGDDLLIMRESDILGVIGPAPSDPAKTPIDFQSEVRPKHFETGTGMALNGAAMLGQPVVGPGVSCNAVGPDYPNAWRFRDVASWSAPRAAGSLIFQLDSGEWAGAAVFPERIAGFTVRDGRTIGLVYRANRPNLEAEWEPERTALDAAEQTAQDLINRMLSGSLSNADMLGAVGAVAEVRDFKHIDPVLGVIAAYLYEAAGDRDSIRRMAWFFASRDQPIPFDIALLADLRGIRASEGALRVDVPAVSQRTSFTHENEAARPEFFQETRALQGVAVAGGFPWVRQGWSILADATLPFAPELLELAKDVTPAPFTTMTADAGARLAALVAMGGV